MLKRIATTVLALVMSVTAFAQDATDLEKRLRALEEKIAQMQATQASAELTELRQQIDVLGQEIEKLKTGESAKTVVADTPAHGYGAAASKVYHVESGVAIGGYGEFLYQNPDGEIATADSLRAVVYTGYKFNDRVLFNSELEVEHANLERGGNVELEFAHLDFLQRPALNFRGGLVLMPVGLTNEQHEPNAFLGARRPGVEQVIIPSTWSELGGGVFGDVGPVTYRAYVVTGLDAAYFNAEEGIREGRQAGGEAKAEDWGVVGRADWHPFEGTTFGGSLYTGDSGQNAGFGGRLTLGEVHAQSHFRGAQLRALYSRATLDDVADINAANGLTGEESVGETLGGWYVEGGYDVAGLFKSGRELAVIPFVRYEAFDTQREVPDGFSRNPANDQNILTIGVNFKPMPQTVIKIDWQDVDNAANTGMDQWNIALGYIF